MIELSAVVDNVFGSDANNEDVYRAHPKQVAMAAISGFNGMIYSLVPRKLIVFLCLKLLILRL